MPTPITPVSQQDLPTQLFDPKYSSPANISDLQARLMGMTPEGVREAARKYPIDTLYMLDAIYKNEDSQLTAINQVVLAKSGADARVFRVPEAIGFNKLLSLKTQGLVSGDSRSVKFTDRGRIALRDYWLTTDNHLKTNRAKTEFIHPARQASAQTANRTSEDATSTRRFKR